MDRQDRRDFTGACLFVSHAKEMLCLTLLLYSAYTSFVLGALAAAVNALAPLAPGLGAVGIGIMGGSMSFIAKAAVFAIAF
jgi:hypothetical protein